MKPSFGVLSRNERNIQAIPSWVTKRLCVCGVSDPGVKPTNYSQ